MLGCGGTFTGLGGLRGGGVMGKFLCDTFFLLVAVNCAFHRV